MRFLPALMMALCLVPARAQLASIRGSVLTESGSPVPGAVVLYNNIRPSRRDSVGRIIAAGPAISSGTRTVADGSFLIASLPAGSYYLCASGTRPNQLRSCEWIQAPLRVELGPGQNLTNVNLRIVEGVLIVFRISDPARRIREPHSAGAPFTGAGNFRIGVMQGGRYAHARLLSEAGSFREYGVAVPKNSSVRVFLDSPLPLFEASGQGVPTGRPGGTIATRNEPELRIDLEVR